MDDWEKFNKISFSKKEDFCSHLNIEDTTDADYPYAKGDCRDFQIKKFEEYNGLSVQSNTLLLADVLENFRNMRLEIHELDPTRFLTALGLVSSFQKDQSKIRSFN